MKIMAFTGAGISKASGVPTFEEIPGIRDKLSRQYAEQNPFGFAEVIQNFRDIISKVQPNDAHVALAEYDVPIITINIDGLHQKAGSKNVTELHGNIFKSNVVLYGDPAPYYGVAKINMDAMPYKEYIFLIIGTSFYTCISEELRKKAKQRAKEIIVINDNAETRVREVLDNINSLYKGGIN